MVTIHTTDAGFELHRNGKPFFIRGAGGRAHLEELVAAGGNSVRTWHARDVEAVLEKAHQLGLTVCVGIWLGHERQGFRYSDPASVAHITERARKTVLAYKDHPAVLLWGIGNEMEGEGDQPKVWQTVNDIAQMVKKIDPNHPTMTVIAGTGPNKIEQLNKYCPSIDVVGINAYGDLARIPPALEKQKLNRPYIITEFGPYGWWQVQKTSWGAELEPTSAEKATTYSKSYEVAVKSQPGKCLGAYAFLWGNKQEHTYTWFSMFLPTGERTAPVDEMSRLWTGQYPTQRCPDVGAINMRQAEGDKTNLAASGEHVYAPGTQLLCNVDTDARSNVNRVITWSLHAESSDKKAGGYTEDVPANYPDAIVRTDGNELLLKLPDTPAAYRLFVTITDEGKRAATANVPILVR